MAKSAQQKRVDAQYAHARKYWSWEQLRNGAIRDLIDSIVNGVEPRGEAFMVGYGALAATLDAMGGSRGDGPSDDDVTRYVEIMNDVAQHDFGFETVWFDGTGGVVADITLDSGWFGGDIDLQEVMLLLEAGNEESVAAMLSHPTDWFPSEAKDGHRFETRREYFESRLVEADQILSQRYSPDR